MASTGGGAEFKSFNSMISSSPKAISLPLISAPKTLNLNFNVSLFVCMIFESNDLINSFFSSIVNLRNFYLSNPKRGFGNISCFFISF